MSTPEDSPPRPVETKEEQKPVEQEEEPQNAPPKPRCAPRSTPSGFSVPEINLNKLHLTIQDLNDAFDTLAGV